MLGGRRAERGYLPCDGHWVGEQGCVPTMCGRMTWIDNLCRCQCPSCSAKSPRRHDVALEPTVARPCLSTVDAHRNSWIWAQVDASVGAVELGVFYPRTCCQALTVQKGETVFISPRKRGFKAASSAVQGTTTSRTPWMPGVVLVLHTGTCLFPRCNYY